MDRKIFEKIMIFFNDFWKILDFFQKKKTLGGRAGQDQTSPAIWAGPKLARPNGKVNYSVAACRNEFCMQRPRRRRRRRRRKENHLMWWGSAVVLGMSVRRLRGLRLRWRWPMAEKQRRRRRRSCRGETNAGRRKERRPRWLLGGRLVVETVAEAVTEMVAGGWSWLQVTAGRRKKHVGGAAARRKKTDGGFWWSAGGCVGFLWWSW